MKKVLFVLILILLISFSFAETAPFPNEVTYGGETYYLHSYDEADVGNRVYAGEGAGVLSRLAAAGIKISPTLFDVPPSIYELMKLESERISVISTYRSALKTAQVSSNPSWLKGSFALTNKQIVGITAKMNALKGGLTSAGYTLEIGAAQGIEITKGTEKIFKVVNHVRKFDAAALELVSAGDQFFLKGSAARDLITASKGLAKSDIFLLNRLVKGSAKLKSLSKAIEGANSTSAATAAKNLTRVKDEINALNKIMEAAGKGKNYFRLVSTPGAGGKIVHSVEALANTGSGYRALDALVTAGKSVRTLRGTTPALKVSSKLGALKSILRFLGKAFTVPIQLGVGTVRGVVWGYCEWVIGQETFAGLAPDLTVYYTDNSGNPSLKLFSDFTPMRTCIDDTYKIILTGGDKLFTSGYDVGNKKVGETSKAANITGSVGYGVVNFFDLSSLAADIYDWKTSLEYHACQAAVYSKDKPESVQKIHEVTGVDFTCLDVVESEEADFSNKIYASLYPVGDYLTFQRITLGNGAAEQVWPSVFYKLHPNDKEGDGTYGEYQDYKTTKKIYTYNMLSNTCNNEYGALSTVATKYNLTLRDLIDPDKVQNFSESQVSEISSSKKNVVECIAKNGFYTETLKFTGMTGVIEEGTDSDTLTISFKVSGTSQDLLAFFKEQLNDPSLDNASLINKMTLKKNDGKVISATSISVSGDKITIVMPKGILVDGGKYILSISDSEGGYFEITAVKKKN